MGENIKGKVHCGQSYTQQLKEFWDELERDSTKWQKLESALYRQLKIDDDKSWIGVGMNESRIMIFRESSLAILDEKLEPYRPYVLIGVKNAWRQL